MTEEEIGKLLPSIAIARLFHEYGRLDCLLAAGFDESHSEFYGMFWEVIDAAADFVFLDYDDNWGTNKWYFSFDAMVEYYRLCRTYGSLHGMKLRENPYMQRARRFIEGVVDFYGQGGYSWQLCTRISHKWASGIVFQTDEEFNAEYELLEALLAIGDWYARGAKRLREVIEKKNALRH